MADTVSYIKSQREIKECEAFLTSKRFIAFEKPSSIWRTLTNFFSDNKELSFDIPLSDLNSIRDGRMGLRDIVIIKTTSGIEYAMQFPLPEERWKQAIIDAVSKNEPATRIRTLGDYTKFSRQQPK